MRSVWPPRKASEHMADDLVLVLAQARLEDLRLKLEAARRVIHALRRSGRASSDVLDKWEGHLSEILVEIDEQQEIKSLTEGEVAVQISKLKAELAELQSMDTSHLTPGEHTARTDRLARLSGLLHAYKHARPRAVRPGRTNTESGATADDAIPVQEWDLLVKLLDECGENSSHEFTPFPDLSPVDQGKLIGWIRDRFRPSLITRAAGGDAEALATLRHGLDLPE